MTRTLRSFPLTRLTCASSLVLAAALASTSIQAASISSITATWPASPAVQSVDAIGIGAHANRGISGTRNDRQSFQVPNGVTVGQIVLSANAYNNQPFIIGFFS